MNMEILFRISLRNLFRQKRRNLFLGAAIAMGMAILGVANAFSHGISDVLFNRLLKYMSGQVSVVFTQNGNMTRPFFPDGQRMLGLITKTLPAGFSTEEAIGILARVIGNSRTDNMILVGLNVDATNSSKVMEEMRPDFRMVEGDFESLLRTDLENPVLLSNVKAKNLNVKVNDMLRIRFQDVHGQNQAARLTVAGIFNPANIFMATPAFFKLEDIKRIAGYSPDDIGGLHITVSNPKKNAVPTADSVHARLVPPIACVHGTVADKLKTIPVTVFGYKVDSASLKNMTGILSAFAPNRNALSRDDVLISRSLGDSLQLGIGDTIGFSYPTKFRNSNDPAPASTLVTFAITGFLPNPSPFTGHSILVNDKDFYSFFYGNWPKPSDQALSQFLDTLSPIFPYLNREWVLLDRTRSTSDLRKKYVDIARLKTKATTVDVQTMYESASMIINLEYALNIITLSAVLILFFIIQVGVVNTLRMTIRERTREIGTMRSIGMQKSDVRNIFLMETFFLTLFSCLVGSALAFLAMALLKLIRFSSTDNPLGMLLVNHRLHFVPSLVGTLFYLVLILLIAVVTAWFPARRAASLSPSDALRHFG